MKISWSYKEGDFSVFSFFVYRIGNPYPVEIISSDDTSDEIFIYGGGADYYIEFNIANIDVWTISAYDYTAKIENPKEVTWMEVKKFSGRGNSSGKSQTFKISKNRFRIIFEYQKKDLSVFSFFIYRLGEDTPFEIINSEDPKTISYVYEGNKEYYIEFNIANVGDWSIEIQEPGE